jgi:conjugal transfer pilus assembly protein TraU
MVKRLCVALLASAFLAGPASGLQVACPDANVLGSGMFTNVCWSCLFPIRLAGLTLFGGDRGPPPDANGRPLCVCGGDLSQGRLPTVGFSLGFWQPTRILEVVRRPYCFPALKGTVLSGSFSTAGGARTVGGNIGPTGDSSAEEQGFYNFHYYSFPLLALLQLLNAPSCNVGGFDDLDVMFMGEAFPNWYNDELSLLVQPEAVLFANPVALAAMPIDCAAASAGRPMDSAFWVAGCWGSLYPSSGNLVPGNDPVSGSSLVASRAMALMSRLGLVERTVGPDAACGARKMPILKKSQYRLQMMFPVPETKGGPSLSSASPVDTTAGGTQVAAVDPSGLMQGCCHPIGKADLLWGAWRTRPASGEDFVYLVWQWTDCCLGMIP